MGLAGFPKMTGMTEEIKRESGKIKQYGFQKTGKNAFCAKLKLSNIFLE